MPTALAGSFSSSSRSKGQLEAYEPHPSHRKLIEFLIIVLVAGGIFLYFWQAVLQFSFLPATFDENYCIRLLKDFEPELTQERLADTATGKTASFFRSDETSTVTIENVGGTARSCQVVLNTNKVLSGYGGSYPCDIYTISYRSEESQTHLMLAIQSAFPPEFIQAGIQQFTYTITYYNTADRASYEAALAKLRNNECAL